MDLYLYEQRLRDEVIYLHSLWHQGPPTTTTISKRRPRSENNNTITHNKKKKLKAAAESSALNLQLRASNAFQQFFAKSDEDGGTTGDAKYQFFLRVFMEDSELRRYYEENFDGGEFCCLVCCELGHKNKEDLGNSSFKTCVKLVHHSAAMAKTERNSSSHGAFARVVCRLLGWDFNQLPAIVSKGEPLGWTLAETSKRKGSHKNGENIDEKELLDGQESSQLLVSSSEWQYETPVNKSEGRARLVAMPLQQKAVKACQEFLASHLGSGSDESDDEEEEDQSEESDECESEDGEEDSSDNSEDEDEDPSEDSEDEKEDSSGDSDDEDEDAYEDCEVFNFFMKLFMEDDKLRDFYTNNYVDGEFCCLVCGRMEEMAPKSFRGCVALLQHSTTMSMTSKMLAHRAYGKAICQILGWDFNMFPSITSKGESLGQTLSKLGNSQGLKQPLVSSSEWPCKKPVKNSPSAVLEWPPFTPPSVSTVSPLSAEEKAKFNAVQLQQKAVNDCQDFLTNNSSSDSDEEEDENEDVSEDGDEYDAEDENTDASDNTKEFDFFLKLFREDVKLREFYVKNSEVAEFCCLVCCGIGKKVWKRYTGCAALVQHSISISKTKKKLAHKAYGKVICQVLGWDFNRFPSIVLNSESHGQSSAKSDDLQGESKENSDGLLR